MKTVSKVGRTARKGGIQRRKKETRYRIKGHVCGLGKGGRTKKRNKE